MHIGTVWLDFLEGEKMGLTSLWENNIDKGDNGLHFIICCVRLNVHCWCCWWKRPHVAVWWCHYYCFTISSNPEPMVQWFLVFFATLMKCGIYLFHLSFHRWRNNHTIFHQKLWVSFTATIIHLLYSRLDFIYHLPIHLVQIGPK